MTFGGIAGRRKGQDVGIVVENNRSEVRVHTINETTIAIGGGVSHPVEKGLSLGRNVGRGEPGSHMVANAGFAGRVDFPIGELRHEHSRFHPHGALQVKQATRSQKFVKPIQAIEFHDSGGFQSVSLGFQSKVTGRISPIIVGKESMGVQI